MSWNPLESILTSCDRVAVLSSFTGPRPRSCGCACSTSCRRTRTSARLCSRSKLCANRRGAQRGRKRDMSRCWYVQKDTALLHGSPRRLRDLLLHLKLFPEYLSIQHLTVACAYGYAAYPALPFGCSGLLNRAEHSNGHLLTLSWSQRLLRDLAGHDPCVWRCTSCLRLAQGAVRPRRRRLPRACTQAPRGLRTTLSSSPFCSD